MIRDSSKDEDHSQTDEAEMGMSYRELGVFGYYYAEILDVNS